MPKSTARKMRSFEFDRYICRNYTSWNSGFHNVYVNGSRNVSIIDTIVYYYRYYRNGDGTHFTHRCAGLNAWIMYELTRWSLRRLSRADLLFAIFSRGELLKCCMCIELWGQFKREFYETSVRLSWALNEISVHWKK